mmetsp:Transcript_21193/g.34499  ORF Transcript_21193/g.34499 Transcript_21193/m.34499 type:complete len:81 (-) Transcript_21193:137-379(-)
MEDTVGLIAVIAGIVVGFAFVFFIYCAVRKRDAGLKRQAKRPTTGPGVRESEQELAVVQNLEKGCPGCPQRGARVVSFDI